jgi:hypothetical protein
MPNGRCRMHGGRSGGPLGARNGAYKTGKYTREAREVSALMRELARTGEVMTATVMNRHGVRPVKALRRRTHVKRALKKVKEEGKA